MPVDCSFKPQTQYREYVIMTHITPWTSKSLYEQEDSKYDLHESLVQAGLTHFVSMVHNEKIVFSMI